MQGADVAIDMRMLPGDDDRLSFVGMTEVCHHDPHLGEPAGHRVQVSRERAFERRLCEERRPRVQQHRQRVVRRIAPQGIEAFVLRQEARVHRHEFDATQTQRAVPFTEFVFPARLGGVEREESDPLVGMGRHLFGHVGVVDHKPESRAFPPNTTVRTGTLAAAM